MSSAIIYLVIYSMLLIKGLSGNIFILVVHFLDWQKSKVHNPCNIIINSIATINIFLQGCTTFGGICYVMYPELSNKISNLLTAAYVSLILSSLWCCTCLCFYYCIKIVPFKLSFLSKLKAKLSMVVPWLIGVSVLLSFSVGLQTYLDLAVSTSFSTRNVTGNVTIVAYYHFESKCHCLFVICTLVASLAFAIIALTGGTLITTLCRHMSRMRQSNEGSGHSRIQTYISAAQTVITLLILYLIFYTAFTLLSNPKTITDNVTILVCQLVVSSFPTVNSIILVFRTRKLTNTLKRVLGIKVQVENTDVTTATD